MALLIRTNVTFPDPRSESNPDSPSEEAYSEHPRYQRKIATRRRGHGGKGMNVIGHSGEADSPTSEVQTGPSEGDKSWRDESSPSIYTRVSSLEQFVEKLNQSARRFLQDLLPASQQASQVSNADKASQSPALSSPGPGLQGGKGVSPSGHATRKSDGGDVVKQDTLDNELRDLLGKMPTQPSPPSPPASGSFPSTKLATLAATVPEETAGIAMPPPGAQTPSLNTPVTLSPSSANMPPTPEAATSNSSLNSADGERAIEMATRPTKVTTPIHATPPVQATPPTVDTPPIKATPPTQLALPPGQPTEPGMAPTPLTAENVELFNKKPKGEGVAEGKAGTAEDLKEVLEDPSPAEKATIDDDVISVSSEGGKSNTSETSTASNATTAPSEISVADSKGGRSSGAAG